jgi:hypothetical protein
VPTDNNKKFRMNPQVARSIAKPPMAAMSDAIADPAQADAPKGGALLVTISRNKDGGFHSVVHLEGGGCAEADHATLDEATAAGKAAFEGAAPAEADGMEHAVPAAAEEGEV